MVRVPTYRVVYAGVDITNNIKSLVESLEFVDKSDSEESDEITLVLDNSDLRWLGSWLPKPGDTISVQFGYADGQMSPEIGFEIDEPEWSGVPDTLTLQGLATPVKSSLRQKNNVGWEGVSLRDIAAQIAEKHGLTLVNGDKLPDIELERVTQRGEGDLQLLQRLAEEYDIILKLDSANRLVFYKNSELEAAAAVATISRTDCRSYRVKRGAVGTYAGVSFNYLDPASGEYEEVALDAQGNELVTEKDGESEITTEDQLVVKERFQSREDGELKAKAALAKANRGEVEGSIELEGNPALSAGVNINLAVFGGMSGKYQITQIRHRISRDQGYTSSLEIKGINLQSDPVEPVSA